MCGTETDYRRKKNRIKHVRVCMKKGIDTCLFTSGRRGDGAHEETHTPTEDKEKETEKTQSQKKAEDDVYMCIYIFLTQNNKKETMMMPLGGDRWIYIYTYVANLSLNR